MDAGPGANGGENGDVVVLKFGSSILRDADDLPRVVAEIYRRVRKGERVVAVVSAFAGETDALIAESARFDANGDNIHAPRLVALGEERTAALLALACDQTGLAVKVLTPAEMGLRASGDPRNADPLGIDRAAFDFALETCEVVVCPGFFAVGAKDEPVLLGRGGSDLTAIIIAAELGLGEASLLKDVDGVYDHDPAKSLDGARRFARISYDDAREVSGELIQPRAIDYAEARGVAARVGRLAAAGETVVGKRTTPPEPVEGKAPLKVALAGCGVVGSGLADLLLGQEADFTLSAVLVRDLKRARPASTDGAAFVTSLDELLAQEPDIVVDALSSGDIGRDLTFAALKRGIALASANKQAIADDIVELAELSRTIGCPLEYAASVGGGAPMVETVRRVAGVRPIAAMEAIVNGTVNFILSELASGRAFDEAVKAAQEAGFAEADPSADLSGADAVAKAKILSFEAFGDAISGPVLHEALGEAKLAEIAAAPGVWRQVTRIARGADGAPAAEVVYRRIEPGDFLHDLKGERNAIRIETRDGAVFTARGRGAGAVPTAHAILGDLGAIRRARLRRGEG